MTDTTLTRPAELTMDPTTGALVLQTSSDNKRDYEITILVTNEGGNAPHTLLVPEIGSYVISVECDESSTTLTVNPLEELSKGNIYDDVLTVTGKFFSENPYCPVEDYSLATGVSLFDFSSNLATSDDFDVTLNAATNAVVGVHEFVVTATAEGGLTLDVAGSMTVNKICISTVNAEWSSGSKQFLLDLPLFGTETEEFPTAASDYVNAPDALCTQTFSYRMANNGDLPAELTINSETGIFSLLKNQETKAVYEIEIIIDSAGGVEPHQLIIGNVDVKVVCGPESTVLAAPAMEAPSRASFQNGYTLSASGAFESLN